jgi:ubiquinone/menaquinone biosynthesis C-methylase UbiE
MGLDGLNVARLTLVEIDPRQVSRNKIAHETIVGDMQTIELPAESFDLVICYNVIEHLPRLTEALERMSRVVKRDGLVVIGAPVPNSLSGLAARFTPHLVHVWICGICSNGRMRENRGCAPFSGRVSEARSAERFAVSCTKAWARAGLFPHLFRFPDRRDWAQESAVGALCGDYHLVLRKI